MSTVGYIVGDREQNFNRRLALAQHSQTSDRYAIKWSVTATHLMIRNASICSGKLVCPLDSQISTSENKAYISMQNTMSRDHLWTESAGIQTSPRRISIASRVRMTKSGPT